MKDKILSKIKRLRFSLNSLDPVSGRKLPKNNDSETLGNSAASWTIPKDYLDPESVCYLAGAGEDISFDISVATKYQCSTIILDPTPKAQAHFKKVESQIPSKIRRLVKFIPIGIWKENTHIKFYAPENPDHVSHSIVNLQKTAAFFEAEVNTLGTLMKKEGHSKVDLLKIDIEGAEYEVINAFLSEGIRPKIFCVEFDEILNPLDSNFKQRINKALDQLFQNGYKLYYLDFPSNYTLVHTNQIK